MVAKTGNTLLQSIVVCLTGIMEKLKELDADFVVHGDTAERAFRRAAVR